MLTAEKDNLPKKGKKAARDGEAMERRVTKKSLSGGDVTVTIYIKRRIYILFHLLQTDSQELKSQWLYPELTSERHQDIQDLHLKSILYVFKGLKEHFVKDFISFQD